ncbi:MAG TPA: EAL domain-containing protein, partial [Longimicrobiales bacterium]|nr:EAL domain-containing protein [Longimicrobiales bacterium]
VDLIKLDRSFVSDIGKDEKDERLIEAIVALAHRIGAQILAEGVEQEAQMAWLRSVGCDLVQGYLVGRPGPAEGIRTVTR